MRLSLVKKRKIVKKWAVLCVHRPQTLLYISPLNCVLFSWPLFNLYTHTCTLHSVWLPFHFLRTLQTYTACEFNYLIFLSIRIRLIGFNTLRRIHDNRKSNIQWSSLFQLKLLNYPTIGNCTYFIFFLFYFFLFLFSISLSLSLLLLFPFFSFFHNLHLFFFSKFMRIPQKKLMRNRNVLIKRIQTLKAEMLSLDIVYSIIESPAMSPFRTCVFSCCLFFSYFCCAHLISPTAIIRYIRIEFIKTSMTKHIFRRRLITSQNLDKKMKKKKTESRPSKAFALTKKNPKILLNHSTRQKKTDLTIGGSNWLL